MSKQLTLKNLAEQIAQRNGVEIGKIFAACRFCSVVAARNQLIFEAVNGGIASKAELARQLGFDPARITRGYQAVAEKNNKSTISQT